MSTDSDMDVSRKLICLFMLLSGSCVNSISHSKITNMYLKDTECIFVFDVLKHFGQSFKEKPLVFRVFLQNPKLCPVSTLVQYLDIRLSRSYDTALFLITVMPYKGASSDTIAHWKKNTILETGINTGIFHPIIADLLPNSWETQMFKGKTFLRLYSKKEIYILQNQ